MKKLLLLTLMTLLHSSNGFTANEYFRSIASGNWNSNSTWEMSTNSGSNWIAATLTPDNTSGVVTVRNTHTVTVTASVSIDQLVIDSAGIISINNAIVLTILNGSGNDLTNSGTISGAGTLRTSGTEVDISQRIYANITSALNVAVGILDIREYTSPFICRVRGNITVDTGATLFIGTSNSYIFEAYGNTTLNGSITGTNANFTTRGPSFIHNGVIGIDLRFDSTTTYSGAGTFNTSADYIEFHDNANVTLANDVTFNPDISMLMYSGSILNPNSKIISYTRGTLEMETGSTVVNSGSMRTSNTVTLNLHGGSSFNAPLTVLSGTTDIRDFSPPYIGSLYNNLTIDNGAILQVGTSNSYDLQVFGNLVNNGTITGTNSNLVIKGPSFTHNGIMATDLMIDTTTNYSGTGNYSTTADYIEFFDGANVTLGTDVTINPDVSMIMYAGSVLNPNSKIISFTRGTLEMNSGSTVTNSGTFRTSNNVTLNLHGGSSFNAPLNVLSGITDARDFSPPFNARMYGSITINNGATFYVGSTNSYNLIAYGNVTNNGIITGTNSNFILKGPSLVNNNVITTDIQLDSNSTYSGTGSFNTGDFVSIGSNCTITLGSNVTFSPSNLFTMNSGATLNLNSFTLNFNSGTFVITSTASVLNSGLFKINGNANLNLRNGSTFSAPLQVASGNCIASDQSSPFIGRLYGPVTVDNGATLSANTTSSYDLEIYSHLTNNGTITGNSSELVFAGGAQNIQGTGVITIIMTIRNGSNVILLNDHSFRNVNINTGGTFNITNRTARFTASDPILQNGTLTTTNSNIEYNGTSGQSISSVNIVYDGLRINNPAGTTLLNNISVADTIALVNGDIELNARIITLGPAGFLSETPGNTIKGNSGYITATRTLNSPSSLNVAGLGAVLTTSVNMGSTEIRRGHTVQNGLNGGTSIRRYFDITPTTNTGLNATLKFKYDDSELNSKPEPSLKLFKSTNTGSTWLYQIGTINTSLNEITLNGIPSFSRWSSDTSNVSASIALIIQGFYNASGNSMNMSDTVKAYLRSTVFPYNAVDSAVSVVSETTLRAGFQFANAPTGTYYLQMKHRNSIETWSSAGVSYTAGVTLNHDFTFAASQAFGNNQIQVDASPLRFAFYSGDVNQDETIDLSDIIAVFNDASAFLSGYVVTDVNGDDFVDLTDLSITFNNANNFVSVIKP